MNTRKWRRPDYLEITADLVMDAIGKARSAGVPLYMIREGINWLCSEIDWYNDDQTVPPTPERLRVVHPPGTQLRLPFTSTEHSSMSTDSTAEVALLRCPHTDQPPLEVTWFCGRCSRCYGSVQVPKHEFDDLVAGGRRVMLVCFECWTRADNDPNPLARIAAKGGAK